MLCLLSQVAITSHSVQREFSNRNLEPDICMDTLVERQAASSLLRSQHAYAEAFKCHSIVYLVVRFFLVVFFFMACTSEKSVRAEANFPTSPPLSLSL